MTSFTTCLAFWTGRGRLAGILYERYMFSRPVSLFCTLFPLPLPPVLLPGSPPRPAPRPVRSPRLPFMFYRFERRCLFRILRVSFLLLGYISLPRLKSCSNLRSILSNFPLYAPSRKLILRALFMVVDNTALYSSESGSGFVVRSESSNSFSIRKRSSPILPLCFCTTSTTALNLLK